MPRRLTCPVGTSPTPFNAVNPEAVRWANERSAALIREIGRTTRAAIRAIVANAIETGVPPRELARQVRTLVGLTERDALAVLRREARDTLAGMDADKVRARSLRYADKLHRRRALTIARTETMAAANEGQQQLWRQAVQDRLLSRDMLKVWIVADPCPQCAPLDGMTAPVTGTFRVGKNPPLHPNCRCTVGLVLPTTRRRR